MIILFSGIDGSGKSTIIKTLESRGSFGNSYYSMRGGYVVKIIKPISKYIWKNKVKSSVNYNYISASDYSKWRDYKKKLLNNVILNHLFYFLQSFDYLLQIWSNDIKNYLHSHKVIIMDRYILDYLVNQSVFYGDISDRYIYKILIKKMHKIDIIIFIDVNCNTAFKRKNDIPSVKYLEERKSYYIKYSEGMNNYHNINNNESMNNSVIQIERILGIK